MGSLTYQVKGEDVVSVDDVVFFELQEIDKMNEDGELETGGFAFYYEREKDEIGQGTRVSLDDIIFYNYDDPEIER